MEAQENFRGKRLRRGKNKNTRFNRGMHNSKKGTATAKRTNRSRKGGKRRGWRKKGQGWISVAEVKVKRSTRGREIDGRDTVSRKKRKRGSIKKRSLSLKTIKGQMTRIKGNQKKRGTRRKKNSPQRLRQDPRIKRSRRVTQFRQGRKRREGKKIRGADKRDGYGKEKKKKKLVSFERETGGQKKKNSILKFPTTMNELQKKG